MVPAHLRGPEKHCRKTLRIDLCSSVSMHKSKGPKKKKSRKSLENKIYLLPLALVVLVVLQPAAEWRKRLCQVSVSNVTKITLIQGKSFGIVSGLNSFWRPKSKGGHSSFIGGMDIKQQTQSDGDLVWRIRFCSQHHLLSTSALADFVHLTMALSAELLRGSKRIWLGSLCSRNVVFCPLVLP